MKFKINDRVAIYGSSSDGNRINYDRLTGTITCINTYERSKWLKKEKRTPNLINVKLDDTGEIRSFHRKQLRKLTFKIVKK